MVFGRSIIDPEVIRMLLFGLAMVVMMLFRPAGLLPSAVRKRELAVRQEWLTAAPAPAARAPFLEVEGVTKRFGGLTALSDVSFSIREGEIYGLIGPNGAGKTTLFNVLTGIYRQDEGRFRFEGAGAAGRHAGPHRAPRHRAHLPEHPPLRQPLRARERDDRPPRAHAGRACSARSCAPGARAPRSAAIEKRARELLEYVGIAQRGNELAKHLSYGDQRRLEIARAPRHRAAPPRPRRARRGHERHREARAAQARSSRSARTASRILLIEHDVRW